jgi:CBS domain-containing protein
VAVESIASRDVVTIQPHDSLLDALERFVEEGVTHLPVVDAGQHLVGMCTRTDLLRVEARRLAAERRSSSRQPPTLRRRGQTIDG